MSIPCRILQLLRPSIVVAAVALSLCMPFSVIYCSTAQGGNKELIEKWEQQKQVLKGKVVEKLRREGNLPKDGIVVFTAVLKPGRKNVDQPDIEIQSLEVYKTENGSKRKGINSAGDLESADTKAIEKIFTPRTLEPVYTIGRIEFNKGRQVAESIALRSGLTGGGTGASFQGEASGVAAGSISAKTDSLYSKGIEVNTEAKLGSPPSDQESEEQEEPVGWWGRLWNKIKTWWRELEQNQQ